MGAAAKQLYISQPTVSQVIAEIEEQYGVKLFERLSKKLYITREGRQLLDYARHIIALFDEMERSLNYAAAHHSLRVGATITVGSSVLPAIIRGFEERHPDITTQVWVDNTQVIEGMILESGLDLALVEGEVSSPDLTVTPVLEDELVLICGEGHPFSQLQSVSLQELEGQDFVLREPGSGTRERFSAILAQKGVTVRPKWVCHSSDSILAAVAQGQGLSVVSRRLAQQSVQEKELHILPIEDVKLHRTFNLIYHKNKFLSEPMRAFLDELLPAD